MNLSLFQYSYPPERIAQHPLSERDASRMMVLQRPTSEHMLTGNICHEWVKNLPEYLRAGDLLVFNDTKVFPARLIAGKIEILLLETTGQKTWTCLAKPLKKIKEGMELVFSESLKGVITKKTAEELEIKFETDDLEKELEKIGLPPLPPYIKRKSAADYTPEDRERYQSIFARHKGSAAAPTASLHFSEKLLETIKAKGIETAYCTLHVSRDTFLPIREEEVMRHKMHGEHFHVPEETKEKIGQTKKNGGRVIAVGTRRCELWRATGASRSPIIIYTPATPSKSSTASLPIFTSPHPPFSSWSPPLPAENSSCNLIKKRYPSATDCSASAIAC